MHKAIRRDAHINWIADPTHKHRETRGLTAQGRKYRGLVGKGHKHKSLRPSGRAAWRRHNTVSLRRYR
jgi:large subunit ribosomal protein L15e